MDFRDRSPDDPADAGGTTDAFPAPDEADPVDIERYNHAFLEANPGVAVREGPPGDEAATMDTPFAKQDAGLPEGADPNWKAEFPWLYDPSMGRRWDFDPVELRVLSQENAWVQMMIQSISKEVAETSWTITTTDDARETDKRLATPPGERTPIQKDLPDAQAERIYEDLRRPVPHLDWSDAIEMWMRDYLEVGSMVATKIFDERYYDAENELTADPLDLEPLALQPTAPEVWTKDYNDKSGVPSGYWQFSRRSSPGATRQASRGVGDPEHFALREVMWSDNSPATNRAYGSPPTLNVAEHIQSLDLAVEQEQNYLSRGSIPSGAWVFEEWDREEVLEWKANNAENLRGKPHKSMMFAGRGGDVKFEPMSMNFQELEFTERMRWYARVVAAAFQVPTAVVGVEPEQINYSTFQGERENFETNTLGPYLQDVERWLNHGWLEHYDGYRFEFTPGFSETTRQMRSDRIRQEWNANLRPREDAARELGIDLPDDAAEGFKDDVVDGSPEADAGDAIGDLVASRVEKEFAADVFAVRPSDDDADRFDSDTLGLGIDFPNDAVYVDWNNSAFPDELAESHVSIYGSIEDLTDATGNVVEPIGSVDAESADLAQSIVNTAKAEYDVGDGTIDLTPPEYMVAAADAAAEAGDEGLIPDDCGTGRGDDRRTQIQNDKVGPDVVDEMATYLTSHAEDVTAEGSPGEWTDDEWADCGNAQYAKWGGTGDGRAMEWAQDRSDEVAELRGEEPTYKSVERDGHEHAHDAPDTSPDGNTTESTNAHTTALSGQTDMAKDEPLRNTDEWAMFDVQAGEIEALASDLAADFEDLFADVLDDPEIQDAIDSMAADEDGETSKSVTAVARRLKELLTDNALAESIQTRLEEASVNEALEAIENVSAEADASVDVDERAIREQLSDRTQQFADDIAENMAEDIRETVGDGFAEGKNSREIAQDIADQGDLEAGWGGAERIARQELQIASGKAREAVAADLGKVEVWRTAGDDRVRDAHAEMDGTWKRPGESWEVNYERGSRAESVPGDSEPGIGCRCVTQLVDREDVDDADYGGDGDAV